MSKTAAHDNRDGDAKNAVSLPETSTYSSRFDAKQRDLIELAAAKSNWSPAKFIREAALRRAVDVLNADGRAEARLRDLARSLVQHLFNPTVDLDIVVEHEFSTEEWGTRKLTVSRHASEQPSQPDLPPCEDTYGELRRATPNRPHDSELKQMKLAMETSGTRFIELLLQQWDGWGKEDLEYEPRISLAEVTGGSDVEKSEGAKP